MTRQGGWNFNEEKRIRMRLSEAIMLGRFTIDSPVQGDVSACAIAMALNAVGRYRDDSIVDWVSPRYQAMGELWPWLDDMKGKPCPFNTKHGLLGTSEMCSGLVPHLFDYHVSLGTMTLEEMCDYIRSIEPAEAEAPPAEQPRETVTVGRDPLECEPQRTNL